MEHFYTQEEHALWDSSLQHHLDEDEVSQHVWTRKHQVTAWPMQGLPSLTHGFSGFKSNSIISPNVVGVLNAPGNPSKTESACPTLHQVTSGRAPRVSPACQQQLVL